MSDQNQLEESPIMLALRKYVMNNGGLGGTDQKETQVAMNVDSSSGTARGYADGGVVGDDMGDVPVPGEATPGFLDRLKAMMSSPAAKVAGFAANPMNALANGVSAMAPGILKSETPFLSRVAGLGATPANAATPPPAAMPPTVPRGTPPPPMVEPEANVPMQPPPHMPGMQDVLGQARQAGGELYGQYSPERRNELYAYLAQRANGLPNAIANSLASVGDAIAKGYGHDAGANALDKTLQTEKAGREEALNAFDAGQKGTLAATSAGMELQKNDPNSSISKISREAYGPLLAKLGYSPASLSKMSAANVETVAKVAADLGGKEMENLFHQAQLIVESQFHKAELGEKDAARKAEALKTISEHPISTMLPTAANQAIKAQAGITPGAGGAGAPLYAVNKDGHRIMSIDGGHTWRDAK